MEAIDLGPEDPVGAAFQGFGRWWRARRSAAAFGWLDEGRVRLHRLGTSDLPEIERHLLALGAADRRARFGSALTDAGVLAYARRIDPARAVLVGAVHAPSGRIVGLAEAQPTEVPGVVELAVSVDSPWRRRGLGGRLLGRAAAGAFRRGAESAELFFDPGNRAAIRLAEGLGARVDPDREWAEIRRGGAAAGPRVRGAYGLMSLRRYVYS